MCGGGRDGCVLGGGSWLGGLARLPRRCCGPPWLQHCLDPRSRPVCRPHAAAPAVQARELEELAQIYVARGLPYSLARQVAQVLTDKDVIRAHARDELGIE